VQIRIANNIDAESLVALINAAFWISEGPITGRERIDLETLRLLLAKGKFLVAEDEGTLAGCVYLEARGERCYLGLLTVDPERQKSGIGSILMREAEERSVQEGFRFIDLRTINLKENNIAFYKHRGYIETGTEPFPAEIATKLPCHFVRFSKQLR
jgi:predicted N-acetyltransferase YhbS